MPTKTLQIPTTDGQADAFAAFPGRDERHPGVLLYTDVFGVRRTSLVTDEPGGGSKLSTKRVAR